VSSLYQGLIERIRGEVTDLEQVIERAEQSWLLSQQVSLVQQHIYVDSVALNLHGFYSGVERLFELIARQVDHTLPEHSAWHRDLLQQMAQDLPTVRPAVVSQENAAIIDEFRRFRHLVRNVYTINLAPEKMTGLMEALPKVVASVKGGVVSFCRLFGSNRYILVKYRSPA